MQKPTRKQLSRALRRFEKAIKTVDRFYEYGFDRAEEEKAEHELKLARKRLDAMLDAVAE
jgi:hypothetical protein